MTDYSYFCINFVFVNEMDSLKTCRICLELKADSFSIYNVILGKSLPSVIENIIGTQITTTEIPDALICQECAVALIQAEVIIEKCRSSLPLLISSVKEELQEEEEITDHEDFTERDESPLLKVFNAHLEPPAKALEEALIEIETKEEPISELLFSAIDPENVKNSDDETKQLERKTGNSEEDTKQQAQKAGSNEMPRQKRKYTKKKVGKRILKINPKADWHFKCDLCSFESDFAAYFKTHLIEVHNKEKPKIFICPHCSESYQLHSSLRQHIDVVHDQKPRRKRTRNILCTGCGKKFPCRNSLRIHMHMHTGEPLPFKCDESECTKSYASLASLQYHKTSAHLQEKKFSCDICGKSFALIFALRSHMKSHCDPNERQDCPNCGRSYRSQELYDKHVLSEKCKNSVHPCQYPNCNKRFSRPRKMKIHMMNMHPRNTDELPKTETKPIK